MAHPRSTIREAATQLIRAAGTEAGRRVYNSRDFTLNTNATPAIVVYTLAERIEAYLEGGIRRRSMDMRVECYHTGDDGADAVDLMAWQAEAALCPDPEAVPAALNGLAESCKLQATNMAFAEQGEHALHAAVLDFEVIYYTHQIDEGDGPVVKILFAVSHDKRDFGIGNEPNYNPIDGEACDD